MAEALAEEVAADGREGSLIVRPDDVAFTAIRRKAGDVLALTRSGVDPAGVAGPQGVTVAQAIEQHIAAPRKKPLEQRTVEYYSKLLPYLGPLANVPLLRLDQAAIIKLRDKLHKEHGPQIAVMVLRLLKASWNTATFYDSRLGPFPKMPKGATSQGKPKKSRVKNLPQWFVEAGGVQSQQRKDLWLLGIMTGLRRGDLVSIRREHVTGCTLTVPKPKGGESRAFELPLSDAACELVQRVLRSHNSEWLWPSPTSKSGHVENPVPTPEDGFSLKWSLHDLRRSWASVAAAVGINRFHQDLLMNHELEAGDVTAGYIALGSEDLRPSQQAITDRLRELGLPL
jgi:integrase